MTFFHFGNCIALAYGPYFLTYKYSGLPEYGAFWKCAQVVGMYMATQLCKMLLLATFFPTWDGLNDTPNLFTEIIKTSVDLGDLIGLSIVMGRIAGTGHMKVLIAGLGWAAADLVLTRALPLWVGARGLEFQWKYIQMSLDANICLVHHLNVAVLLWLWWRSDLAITVRPIVATLLAFCIYRPLLPYFLASMFGSKLTGFALLAATGTPTICSAIISLYMFVSHTSTVRSY